MRILYITTFLQGGAGKIILNLALDQYHKGHEVSILTSKTPEPGYFNYPEYIQILKKHHIDLIEVDSTFKRDLYLNFNAISSIRQLLAQFFHIDIIHAHAAIPSLIGLIASSGASYSIPIIQTMHGWGLNKNLLQEQMDITIMNGLNKVVAVSLADKNLLEKKGVDKNRLVTIYNGIETEEFLSGQSISDPVFRELKSFKDQGYQIIGCIGEVCDRKNQALLLEAFTYLQNKDRLKCIFIGDGEQIKLLQDRVHTNGLDEHIKFYGYQKQASQYLKMFDCLVLPSKSEGLALTILEAFQAEIPVLTSDIPSFQELIEDTVTGYLFKSEDALSLAAQLDRMLSDKKESFIPILKNAKQKFKCSFTTQAMVNAYEELYNSLLSS